MEAALAAANSDMSLECQHEIESNMENIANMRNKENIVKQKSGRPKKAAEVPKENPMFWIITFFIVFFLSTVCYIFFVNSNLDKTSSKKNTKKEKEKDKRFALMKKR